MTFGLHTSFIMVLSFLSFFGCKSKSSAMDRETDAERLAAFEKYTHALYPVRIKNKWGYMNRNGDIVIKPSFAEAQDFFEGRAIAADEMGDRLRYGYIDTKGQWIIQPQYERASPFYENKAAVSKDSKYGYIDQTGAEIIPLQFVGAGRFSEGVAAIQKNGWTGFINAAGEIIIEPQYTCSVDYSLFSKGLAPVFGADEMTGYINPQGEWVIEPRFHSAARFSGDIAWAMFQEDDASAPYGFRIRGGYIDRQGDWVIPPEYDFGWDFFEGYATVWKISDDRTQKLWSVIDTTGQKILPDLPYRNMGSITNGLIPVQDENMAWGFINIKGETIIPPKYTGINRFMNGLARMEVGSAFSPRPVYINEKGQEVWND